MRLITVAIHTYERALALRTMLENEGIEVELGSVNLEAPSVSSGVRVRIHESDLPLALRIIENAEVFTPAAEIPRSSNSILVPVDFSSHSADAVRLALGLAARHKASITLLHSYIDPYLPGNMQLTDRIANEIADSAARERLELAAQNRMASYVASLLERMKAGDLPMVRVNSKVMEGVPEDAVIEYARLEPPLFVVMSTRRYDRKEREMVGSVTAEVLDGCRNTVLTAPEGATLTERPRRILFMAGLDQSDILAVDTMSRIFPYVKAEVVMVNLPARKNYAERRKHLPAESLLEYCKANFGHFTFSYVPLDSSDPVADVTRMVGSEQFDMIVVPNRRRNALSRLFNPGLAHRILLQTDHQMLVIPV